MTYPHWIVNGRTFERMDYALMFADVVANRSGEEVRVLEKSEDDSGRTMCLSPAWVMRTVKPKKED